MAKRRKGRFCWACASFLPNERFSGGGHARHLCRACTCLPADELEARQGRRDIERMLDWDRRVRRRHRKSFAKMLEHPHPAVRAFAQDIAARMARGHVDEEDEYEAARTTDGYVGCVDVHADEDEHALIGWLAADDT